MRILFLPPFLLILSFFLLFAPMLNFKCAQIEITNFTGVDMLVGREISHPMSENEQVVQPVPEMVLMVSLGLIGCIFGFLSFRNRGFLIANGISSLLGFATGIFLYYRLLAALEETRKNDAITGSYFNMQLEPAFYLFILSYFASALVSIVLYFTLDKTTRAPQNSTNLTKKCPYCAETIKFEAVLCRYCGRHLAPVPDSAKADAPHPIVEPDSKAAPLLSDPPVIREYQPNRPPEGSFVTPAETNTQARETPIQQKPEVSAARSRSGRTNRILIGIVCACLLLPGGYYGYLWMQPADNLDVSGSGVMFSPNLSTPGMALNIRSAYNADLKLQTTGEIALLLSVFGIDRISLEYSENQSLQCIHASDDGALTMEMEIRAAEGKFSPLGGTSQKDLVKKPIELSRSASGEWSAAMKGKKLVDTDEQEELDRLVSDLMINEKRFPKDRIKLGESWKSEFVLLCNFPGFDDVEAGNSMTFSDTTTLNGNLCAIITQNLTVNGVIKTGNVFIESNVETVMFTGKGKLVYDLVDNIIVEEVVNGEMVLEVDFEDVLNTSSRVKYGGAIFLEYKAHRLDKPQPATPINDKEPPLQKPDRPIETTSFLPYHKEQAIFFAMHNGNSGEYRDVLRLDITDSIEALVTMPDGTNAFAKVLPFTETWVIKGYESQPDFTLTTLLMQLVAGDYIQSTNCCDYDWNLPVQYVNCFIINQNEVWLGTKEGNSINPKACILSENNSIKGRFTVMPPETISETAAVEYYFEYVGPGRIRKAPAYGPFIQFSDDATRSGCCATKDFGYYSGKLIYSQQGIYNISKAGVDGGVNFQVVTGDINM